MILSCGCSIPYNEDAPDDKWCATWEEVIPQQFTDDGTIQYCYGSLCDEHLMSYNAQRCKLGGEKL